MVVPQYVTGSKELMYSELSNLSGRLVVFLLMFETIS